MFIVAVFISALILKQTRCPSVDEYITSTQWIIIQQLKKKRPAKAQKDVEDS